jgi:hypothetical protein
VLCFAATFGFINLIAVKLKKVSHAKTETRLVINDKDSISSH